MDESHVGQVRECAIYTLAVTNEEAEAWRDSYNAFSVYSETYPKGLFIDDTHQHGAVALMGLVKEEVGKENYSKANSGLDFILTNYGDTPTAADAEKLKSDLRMALGVDLRESGDFAGAEQIFKEINAQAQDNGQNEDVRSSQLELAQTYLAWGLDLQSQEKFAEAKAKFDIAVSTDPDPSSASGPAAQAKASQVDLYIHWGDYLIGQKDFANAMEHYKTAASLSGDQSKANDLIANGFVQWAAESINGEDFLGALILLDFAQESSDTASTKTLVKDTRSDLYFAFSKSDGEQAQQAMEDAVRIVCEHHVQPSLPIFGLDDENVLAGVDGVGAQLLPDSIAATNPASLHYVACIEEDTKVSGTLTLPISTLTFGGGPGVVQITYANFQYFWNVVLRKIETGKDVEETIIEGVEPLALVDYNIDATTFNYFGAKPDIADLADWILTVIE
jgi:tetratricopeptide (TPR) repeat protein